MPPTQKAVFEMGDIVDAVYPADTWLKDLECENCGAGYVIKTGQDFEEDDFDE